MYDLVAVILTVPYCVYSYEDDDDYYYYYYDNADNEGGYSEYLDLDQMLAKSAFSGPSRPRAAACDLHGGTWNRGSRLRDFHEFL